MFICNEYLSLFLKMDDWLAAIQILLPPQHALPSGDERCGSLTRGECQYIYASPLLFNGNFSRGACQLL